MSAWRLKYDVVGDIFADCGEKTSDPFTHLAAHGFVTVFCCPNDVKPVVKFGMASCGIDPVCGKLNNVNIELRDFYLCLTV